MENLCVQVFEKKHACEALEYLVKNLGYTNVSMDGFMVHGYAGGKVRQMAKQVTLDELRSMSKKADLLTDVEAFTAFRDGKAVQCRRTEFDNWQDVRPDVLASVFTGESTFFRLKPIKTIRIGGKEVAAPVKAERVSDPKVATQYVTFCGLELAFATVGEAVEFNKAILNEVTKNV